MKRNPLRSWLAFSLLAFTAAPPAHAGNVILLMLDGVRWQEVFYGVDPELSRDDHADVFSFLLKDLMREGVMFGDRKKGADMQVANSVNVSLPAYQSIMAGETQSCLSNGCGRISVETVQERLVRELGLDRRQVATIASWEKIPHAVEHVEGATFVNASFQDLDDGAYDPVFDGVNKAQAQDVPPWSGARYDRYTFAHAMHYLQKHKPRFMFISLDDSDEWGHKDEYARYLATLRQYDVWIKELVDTLKAMGDYGRDTTLIVTTDHGRGDGGSWKNHGPFWSESKYTWLYGRSPFTHRPLIEEGAAYTHLDIRPTIEAAIGITPQSCEGCGRVIRELIPAGAQ
jgi:hypothetical protein